MDELTVPQPLATLAVEGVVKVLVVDWSPCVSRRWPAEVTIRSSRVEPEYHHDTLLNAGWQLTGDRESLAHWHHGQWLPSHDIPRGEVVGSVTVEAAVPITGGVDEHDADQIVWESTRVITYASKGEHFVAEGWSLTDDGVTHKTGRWAPSDEFGLFDISDQLAFQDFPPGHTALILGGESDG